MVENVGFSEKNLSSDAIVLEVVFTKLEPKIQYNSLVLFSSSLINEIPIIE